MAAGAYRRNLSTSYGRLRRFYVKANGITQGGADTIEQRDALIARVVARKPGAALLLVEFGRDGERIERMVADEATAAAA